MLDSTRRSKKGISHILIENCAVSHTQANRCYVRFSNRPFGVKHFQTIRRCSVDVAHGLVLLFGIGTRALPSWDSRTKWSDLRGGLTV
jgi:hypothetical protein